MLNRNLLELCACPSCNGSLVEDTDGLTCQSCKRHYKYENGFVNFIADEGFEDVRNEARAAAEERMDEYTARNYLLPFLENFQKQFGSTSKPMRALSVGCGVGVDVDILCEQGYDCYGIDCGSRVYSWPNRKFRDHYFIASGKCLPFRTEFFDFVFSFGVIEHIGVVGDTVYTKPSYWEERVKFARELVRVTKPGGYLMISCPNRLFPFDLFHRPGDRYIPPRTHWITEPFLLSYGDLKKIFIGGAQCSSIQPLSVATYWGYNHLLKIFLGKLLAGFMASYFKFVSSERFPFLRTSFLNPFLVVLVRK